MTTITQTEFVETCAGHLTDKVQTQFSLRHNMTAIAKEVGYTGSIEAAAREYEATIGVRLWDGEGPKPGWVESDEAWQAQLAGDAA